MTFLKETKMDFCNFLASSSGVPLPTQEPKRKEYKDFPYTWDDAWILGRKFSVRHDLETMRTFIRSKLWFSYRSNFAPIGGTGPVSDKYWGCMLRCGQMVMGEALIRRHLGSGWKWDPSAKDPVYLQILAMFQDKKDCPYSIHQIAQMGVCEGKKVGQWFGPNTVAQVLRKLSIYDEWSSMAVHIALDNAVIKEDIRTICKTIQKPFTRIQHNFSIIRDPTESLNNKLAKRKSKWRPMLLFIPLRLGLSSLNPIYLRSLKNTFTFSQSLGIIGGRPNHALWFIGNVGSELIYLDPHTTQPTVNLNVKADDSSYHIPYGRSRRMPITDIDPSISLCFYFDSEDDFDDWCNQVQKVLIMQEGQPLFELSPHRPSHWPPLELQPVIDPTPMTGSDYHFVERDRRIDDSDEDFEIFDPIFPSNSQASSSSQ